MAVWDGKVTQQTRNIIKTFTCIYTAVVTQLILKNTELPSNVGYNHNKTKQNKEEQYLMYKCTVSPQEYGMKSNGIHAS